MRTEDLIAQLASDLQPVRSGAAERRIAAGVGFGAVISLIVLLLWFGLRPDLVPAARTAMFWIKLAYPLSLGIAAFLLLDRLGRPTGKGGSLWWILAAPVVGVAGMGVAQLVMAPAADRMTLWLGHTALQCPFRILALSAPVFLGLVWAFRRLAPTRLILAGASAGVMAGATAASIYALACTEGAPAFLATWYTLGVAGAGVMGGVFGWRLLRW